MLSRAVFFALAVAASPVSAQDQTQVDPAAKDERTQWDLTFEYDPEELREHLPPRVRFQKIWGPIGIAGYHVPPAAEPGPNHGPPQTIWTNGWATSMWRDPITGWPLQ